ncbi:MAG: hypothetical protein LBU32_25910 [Clostridiales bacterium]|jgi:hypothetical protein|nr:hypothetical protein [Clostridiales bacterium]
MDLTDACEIIEIRLRFQEDALHPAFAIYLISLEALIYEASNRDVLYANKHLCFRA